VSCIDRRTLPKDAARVVPEGLTLSYLGCFSLRRRHLEPVPAENRNTMAGHNSGAGSRRRSFARRHGQGRLQGAASAAGLEAVRYEGYGPGGAAVLIECLTGDRHRLAAEVRRAFLEHGGALGAAGSVSYLFNTVGLMTYPPGTDEERLMQVAIEAGAEDVIPGADRSMEVLADPLELETVCAMLTHRGFAPATVEVTRRAATSTMLAAEPAELMMQLLERLAGLEEVRDVYSNAEISDEAAPVR
jgi:transcriptional/translational regulatory protein YebC/TACO1